MGFRKGTGFTNLNKVMTANQGNKLGSTVAGGISTQKQGVNTGIQKSKSAFEEEAEKNRLDTDESKQKVGQVLGRFDENNYNVDESQFKVSSGLQSQYDATKQDFTGQKTQQETARQAQLDKIKAQQADYNQKIADLNAKAATAKTATYNKLTGNRATGSTTFDNRETRQVAGTGLSDYEKQELKNYQASLTPLQQLMDTYGATSQVGIDALAGQLSGLDTQFGEQTAAEKKSWIQSEKDRLVAAGLPTDSEMQDFQKYQLGTYAGPRELGDYGSLLSKAMQTEKLGDLSRSGGGRQELLRRFVGGADGQYTQGQRQMDETLLGQDADQVRSAARGTRGLTGNVSAANAQASNVAQEYTNKARQFGEETRGQIQKVRDPLSQRIDQQVGDLTQGEQKRAANAQGIQDLLTSTDAKYAGMDKTARMGLALQAAQDAGYLTPEQAEQLVGEQGLVKRAGELGLDTNTLLAERLKSVAAQGIDRRGAASSDQETRISALDKLMGKRGTDVEFGSGDENYTAGSTGFDLNSLQDYIAKTEGERIKSDPGYAARASAAGLTPLQQLMAGGGQYLSNQLDLKNMVNPVANVNNTLGAVSNIGQGAVGLAGQGLQAGIQGRNAVLNALLKTSIGGQSIANSEAGKQLMKALAFSDNLQSQGIGELTKAGQTYFQGFGDLSSGKLDQALAKLSGFDTAKDVAGNVANTATKAINDVGRAASTALFGGKTGNWDTSRLGQIDASTGQQVAMSDFANRSSGDILKQILSDVQMTQTGQVYDAKKSSQGAGSKRLALLTEYYQNALAREKGQSYSDENLKENIDYTDKDVSSFLDKLKPASYDYKEEVKHDPRASEDRQLGVMAQDLEKSKLGKEAVSEGDAGKIVDYKDLQPKMLASLAALNQRLKKIEGKE